MPKSAARIARSPLFDHLRLDELQNLLAVEAEPGQDRATDRLKLTHLFLLLLQLLFEAPYFLLMQIMLGCTCHRVARRALVVCTNSMDKGAAPQRIVLTVVA